MLVDGKRIAEEIYARLDASGVLHGARLGIVCSEPNAVIESFVRIKQRSAERLGVELVRHDVPAAAGIDGMRSAIAKLIPSVDGIIVQLPLPEGMDTDAVLSAIPGTHDVDGIGPAAQVMPPVARAARAILDDAHIAIEGRRAVVIGAGRLVGAPTARMLESGGAVVTVLQRGDSLEVLSGADIIVSGAGEPGLITLEMIKEGAVLIDAGTSEQGGKVRGDADPACAANCSIFTPVPGGVGPIAVAEIFKNLALLRT